MIIKHDLAVESSSMSSMFTIETQMEEFKHRETNNLHFGRGDESTLMANFGFSGTSEA